MALVKTSPANDASVNALEPFYAGQDAGGFVICKSPEKLKKLLMALQEHTIIDFVSDGDFSMHDLVMQLLKTYHPAELFISTYAIRELPVRQLIMAQERKEILCVKMLLDYRAKVRTPEVFQMANMNMNSIYLTSVHAKVTVIRSAAGCITIVGSQNWTTNPKIEAGVISRSNERAAFHIDWMEKIMSNAEIFM